MTVISLKIFPRIYRMSQETYLVVISRLILSDSIQTGGDPGPHISGCEIVVMGLEISHILVVD